MTTEANTGTTEGTQADPGQGTLPELPSTGAANERDSELAQLRSEAAKWRKALRDREAEIEKLRLAGATEQERAVAAAKAEGAAEFAKKWRRAIVDNAALTALAEKGVTATGPALRCLDLDDIEVDEQSGAFDKNAIASRVDELLTQYPMFAGAKGAPMPTATGDALRNFAGTQPPRPGAKMTDEQAEAYLRYGLGR